MSTPSMFDLIKDTPEYTIRILVPDQIAGKFIGRSGANIREIRNLISSRISVSDGYSYERIISCIGKKDTVFKCLSVILVRLRAAETAAHPSFSSSSQSKIKFLIPSDWVDVASNPTAAADLEKIQLKSDTLVTISTESAGNASEVVIIVAGPPENMVKCMEALFQNFSNRNRASDKDYDPLTTAESLCGTSVLGLEYSGVPLSDEREFQQELIVPNNQIGCIIGHRGAVIDEIRRKSGAAIKIMDGKDSENRKIMISGRLHAVVSAIDEIRNTFTSSNMSTPAPALHVQYQSLPPPPPAYGIVPLVYQPIPPPPPTRPKPSQIDDDKAHSSKRFEPY